MYTFLDRNGESLTMRPEGTAGCVRAVLEHGLSGGGQVQKLWYTGPMFRYEKPQKVATGSSTRSAWKSSTCPVRTSTPS